MFKLVLCSWSPAGLSLQVEALALFLMTVNLKQGVCENRSVCPLFPGFGFVAGFVVVGIPI